MCFTMNTTIYIIVDYAVLFCIMINTYTSLFSNLLPHKGLVMQYRVNRRNVQSKSTLLSAFGRVLFQRYLSDA